MKNILPYLLFTMITGNIVAGGDHDKYFIGGGLSFSTININKDMEGHARCGLNLKAGMKFSPVCRITSEFTNQFSYNIEPSWKHINSQSYELNANFLANLEGADASFYTITGISYQRWSGDFTGINHFYHLIDLGTTPKTYSYSWGSFIAGCGFEKKLNEFSLFGEFKYRISKKQVNVPLNIIDAGYTIGLKYIFDYAPDRSKEKTHQKRHFFRMPNDKYHWF